MLALTRRVGEEVIIGDIDHPVLKVRVVEIHGDKVRLAFDDDGNFIEVNRSELADRKREDRKKQQSDKRRLL